MALIPVICDSCGVLWFSPFIGVEGGSVTVRMTNNVVGPCPNCDGDGHIPDGTYEVSEGVVRFLADALTIPDLWRLRQVLATAQNANASAEATAEEISKKVPKASPIAPLLTQEGAAAASWLALLLSIVTLILSMNGGKKGTVALTPQQVAKIAAAAVGQEERGAKTNSPARRPIRTKKNVRTSPKKAQRSRLQPNQLCWCGSGSKYKHCHGR